MTGEKGASQVGMLERYGNAMSTLTHIFAVTIKELRELLNRPLLILTLIFGPLLVLIIFGIGADIVYRPPRTVVVLPPGERDSPLIERHRKQLETYLRVAEYTDDLGRARRLLAENKIEAVVTIPPRPFETIQGGKQAQISVLYNEIDPTRSWLIPDYATTMQNAINDAILLQGVEDQKEALRDAAREIDTAIGALDAASQLQEGEDREEALRRVREARAAGAVLDGILERLGADLGLLAPAVDTARESIKGVDDRLAQAEGLLRTIGETPDLASAREDFVSVKEGLQQFAALPPAVVVSPVKVRTQYVAPMRPDVITFFAPAMLALLVQHTAVSLGALGLVRERLANTFDLYKVAPISNLELLLGKYLANTLFTLAVTGALVAALLGPFGVPLAGEPWRMALTLLLLTLTSVGFGFALSLVATSERQAVQFAMLLLLGIVFFSGFALPVESLRLPATAVSYSMPATYGSDVLQDVMLRGLPGRGLFLGILALLAAALFALCLRLLAWRTRAE